MTIIKKSGNHQEFSLEKLSHSIAAASDDAQQPLNKSDLNLLISDFQQIVEGKATITTRQINVIVCGLLYTKKYIKALEQYTTFNKKAMV